MWTLPVMPTQPIQSQKIYIITAARGETAVSWQIRQKLHRSGRQLWHFTGKNALAAIVRWQRWWRIKSAETIIEIKDNEQLDIVLGWRSSHRIKGCCWFTTTAAHDLSSAGIISPFEPIFARAPTPSIVFDLSALGATSSLTNHVLMIALFLVLS